MEKGIFDQARSRDLLSTVQQYTGQQGRGRNSVAFFCPKHKERTPSLIVNVSTNTWRDFGGCAVGGDVVDFVEWMEFNSVTKGPMARNADKSLDQNAPRYRALEILMGTIDSTYHVQPVQRKNDYASERKIVDADTVQSMHMQRVPTLDYFVGKRKLTELTVDQRVLGTALSYQHYFKWSDKAKKDTLFECVRYSIPWLCRGKPYMVNYRRDDADCLKRLMQLDPEYVYDIRIDLAKGRDDGRSAQEISNEEIIKHLYGDKYLRNKGSSGFTIFNLDRIMVEGWLPYCTIHEAEISTISAEESGLYSVSSSYKYAVNFEKAFSRVHQPIVFADNDGGTGMAKASKLAEAINNPRTIVKLVPAPFKDMADLIAFDKTNGTNHLKDLRRELGVI